MRRVPLLGLLLTALVLGASASGFLPPTDAERIAIREGIEVAYWVGPDIETADVDVAPGASGTLWFGVSKWDAPPPSDATDENATVDDNATAEENATADENATANETTAQGLPMDARQLAWINVTSDVARFENATIFISQGLYTSQEWEFGNASFTLPENASVQAPYAWSVEVYHEDAEGNLTLLATASGSAAVGVESIEVPAPPGVPREWIVGGVVGLLLVVFGVAVYQTRQRRERARMRGRVRSQALREAELERKLEKAPEPEKRKVQQEIRQVEKQRETRRDLQILEAKRADVLKTMDLLKKRHEMGGLTKHQYDNMVAKKQADLQRIEADIAEMGSRSGDGSAAA